MTDSATFWNKIAAKYARDPIKNKASYDYTLDRTRHYLSAQDHVLEIGAGTASTALELALDVAHVTATDISPEMVRLGQEKAAAAGQSNIDIRVADAMLRDVKGPYDAVLAHNILHLVEDLPAVIARAYELLVPGGYFISKTFCKPLGFGSFEYIATRVALPVMQRLGKAPFVAFFTRAELEAAIQGVGFEIIETGIGAIKDERHYIVARKP